MKKLIKKIKKICKVPDCLIEAAEYNRKTELESLEFRKNLSIYKNI